MNVRCEISIRRPVDGGYTYERVSVPGPSGDTTLHTDHPPDVGDLLYLPTTLRVIERAWLHSSWGSTNWPYGEAESRVGPTLILICEEADGPFIDEVVTPEEGE